MRVDPACSCMSSTETSPLVAALRSDHQLPLSRLGINTIYLFYKPPTMTRRSHKASLVSLPIPRYTLLSTTLLCDSFTMQQDSMPQRRRASLAIHASVLFLSRRQQCPTPTLREGQVPAAILQKPYIPRYAAKSFLETGTSRVMHVANGMG